MDSHIVVYITASSQEEADRLSRGLVEARLAFCVNSVPSVKSTYYWENQLCVDDEFLLIAKPAPTGSMNWRNGWWSITVTTSRK